MDKDTKELSELMKDKALLNKLYEGFIAYHNAKPFELRQHYTELESFIFYLKQREREEKKAQLDKIYDNAYGELITDYNNIVVYLPKIQDKIKWLSNRRECVFESRIYENFEERNKYIDGTLNAIDSILIPLNELVDIVQIMKMMN
jgi:hypothetical protein